MLTDFEKNLIKQAKRSGIIDKIELCNFLAQCAHESADFKRMSESFKYSKGPSQVRAVVSSMRNVPDDILKKACDEAMKNKPEALADLMYNSEYRKNRMGNSQPGDGYKYRGRGVFQLTGKDNYAYMTNAFGKSYGVDFIKNPELILTSPFNELSAITFWKDNVKGSARNSIREARKVINGGYNGLTDVEAKNSKYLKIFANEIEPL